MARRYRVVGGAAAWRLPVLSGILLLCAAALGQWGPGVAVALAAAMLMRLEGALVVEVSATALFRGLVLGGRVVGTPRVLGWGTVSEIATAWHRPGDWTVLETEVRALDGSAIRFTTRMGLTAYRALLADVLAHAPRARRTGLTPELAEEMEDPGAQPSAWRDRALMAAAAVLVAWGLALPWIFARY